jgi:nucleoside 2-deoxyribosyltransferase
MYPLDGNVPASLSSSERARWIYRANVEAMTCADAVMANLNDFRGFCRNNDVEVKFRLHKLRFGLR